MRPLRVSVAAPLALLALAVGFSWSDWSRPVRWTPDALFYEAQARELEGTPAREAREQVFFGQLGLKTAGSAGRLQDERWIEYAAPFYRRRWVVPALADVVRPVFGTRALAIVSLLGYVASGLLAYALARRRFGVLAGTAAGAFTLWYPPMRQWAAYPLTDTMGVAAILLALAAANWALHGRRRRLVAWVAAVLLVAFTRDTAAILVAAAVAMAALVRTRRAVELAAAGAAAAAPALLLFGAPLRRTLAFTFDGNRVPPHESWGYVEHRYGWFVRWMLRTDFPVRSSIPTVALLVGIVALLALRPAPGTALRRAWASGLAVAVAVVIVAAALVAPLRLATLADPVPSGILLVASMLPLFLSPRDRDPFLWLLRGGGIAATAYLFVLPQYTGLRLALVVLPFAALGVAAAVDAVRRPQPQRVFAEIPAFPHLLASR